jgi:hypothetical protein
LLSQTRDYGAPCGAKRTVDDASILIVWREQAQRLFRCVSPRDAGRFSERMFRVQQQAVALHVNGLSTHAFDRLVIEVRQADIDREILEVSQNVD